MPRSASGSMGSSLLHGADVHLEMAQQALAFGSPVGRGPPTASPVDARRTTAASGRNLTAAIAASPPHAVVLDVPLTANALPLDDVDALVLRGQQLLGRMSDTMAVQPLGGGGAAVVRPSPYGPIQQVLRSHRLTPFDTYPINTSNSSSTRGSAAMVFGHPPKRRLPRREF